MGIKLKCLQHLLVKDVDNVNFGQLEVPSSNVWTFYLYNKKLHLETLSVI